MKHGHFCPSSGTVLYFKKLIHANDCFGKENVNNHPDLAFLPMGPVDGEVSKVVWSFSRLLSVSTMSVSLVFKMICSSLANLNGTAYIAATNVLKGVRKVCTTTTLM